MLGLSRWSEKGGSYRTITRFFHTEIDWKSINWFFIKKHLVKKGSVYLLGGDEVVISKSGKESYGLDRFFSSLQNQVIKSLAFLNISIIDVNLRKAYPMVTKQIVRNNKEGCVKTKESKTTKSKKRGVGRPKGSGNKSKKDIELSPYLKFVQEAIQGALKKIDKHVDIVYFVYDGAFGNNQAVQMVKRCGLDIISKLQRNSALCFPNDKPYKGKGAPSKYGDAIDYDNLPDKYLKSTEIDEDNKDITTKIYQMEMLHRKFADLLNIVIIQKINNSTGKIARVTLFSSSLSLDYKTIIDYYSLRFQIEFVFRDAKQHWGMEDFQNVKQTPINNWANLSSFMVNMSHGLRKNDGMKDMSVLDLKAHYHGVKYVSEVFKLLPNLANEYLIKKVLLKITNLGAINPSLEVA